MLVRLKYKLRTIYPFYNWIYKLFSKGNKVRSALLEVRKVAGSATY